VVRISRVLGGLLYVILDGVGDRPNPELNGLTPLEAAYTPNLDRLACRSRLGRVRPAGRGIAPESDMGALAMLGYRVPEEAVPRGVLEALGVGLEIKEGWLALRANFATVDGRLITDRRAGRGLSEEEGKALEKAINDGIDLGDYTFRFLHTIGHRGVLVIHGPQPLSGEITNTDPGYTRLGASTGSGPLTLLECRPLSNSEAALRAARLVNEFTAQALRVLRDHPVNRRRAAAGAKPANAILLRDAGDGPPRIKPLSQKYGLRFACIATMPVERGLARALGMEQVEVGEMDYSAKARMAAELLGGWDVVYVHIKGPDEPAHEGRADLKTRVIERIDREFFGQLPLNLAEATLLVTADHSTPCTLRRHSDDPVPILLAGPRQVPDRLCRFTERFCSKGSLKPAAGWDLLPHVLMAAGLIKP
jgi:2,3-bisphosphoglycerate-independent phosphoglycerate mutase